MTILKWVTCAAMLVAPAAMGTPRLLSAQLLETETARPVGRGVFEISGNFEYQTSSEGHETALPFAVEYGLTDRLELLVEPVAYTAIRPKVGQRATGVGDLELTTTYLLRRETGGTPALALAGELKFPTARNVLIGTRKTDVAGYLIASKMLGRLDAHANLGYTIVGRPAGAQLKNIFNFAVGGEWRWSPRNAAFAEILANTASSAVSSESGGTDAPGAVVAEAPTGELVGTVGVARYVWRSIRLSAGVSVDNNGAVLFRPGFTIRH